MEEFKTFYNAENKTWSGIEKGRIYNENYTLGKAALEMMLKYPKEIGQICYHNGKEYTNDELAKLTISVAQHFTKLGLQQCDVIGICASNTDFLAPLFFGAMLKGLIISSLDISYDKEGIKHAYNMTKPKIMFTDGSIYEKVKEALEECDFNIPIYTMKEHLEGVPAITEFLQHKNESQDYVFEPLKFGVTQTAAILCSSGTTGLPKGVTISHEDLLNRRMIYLRNKSAEHGYLCFSTLHWVSGLFTLMDTTLLGITRIISDKPYSTEDFLKIIEKYRVTILITPPSQLALTLASPAIKSADLSSVQINFCLGSALSCAIIENMKQHMPHCTFWNGYGMSESRCGLAYGVCNNVAGRVGQVGTNVSVKIINTEGARVGPNEIGEFYFTSPFKWLGYYNNPKATEAAYDAEGWIGTGDLGYIDEQGELFLVDRKKDILKYNNFHYFPTEIEHVIYELPDVVEVCVFGLPDLVSTDLPAAAVVKKNGSNLSEEEIYEHVAKRMAHFKHLRGGVYFLEKIPKTTTGKCLRNEAKKICEKLRNEKLLK